MPEENEPGTIAELVRWADQGALIPVRWDHCPHHPEGCPLDL